jgi:hypothetical protein
MIPNKQFRRFTVLPPRTCGYFRAYVQDVIFDMKKDTKGRPTNEQRVWKNGVYGAFLEVVFISDDQMINGAKTRFPVGSCWDKEGNLSPAVGKLKQKDMNKAMFMCAQDHKRLFISAGFSDEYLATNDIELTALGEEYVDVDGTTYPGRILHFSWLGVPADKPTNVTLYGKAARFLPREEWDAYIENGDQVEDKREFAWRKKATTGSGTADTSNNGKVDGSKKTTITRPKRTTREVPAK